MACAQAVLNGLTAPNGFENPQFRDVDKNGIPDGWLWVPPGDGQSTFTSLQGPVAKFVDRDAQKGIGLSQRRAVTPGRGYLFGAETRGAGIFLYLKFLDAKNQLIEPEHRIQARNDNWKRVEIIREAPKNAVACEAWIYTTSVGQGETGVQNPTWQETAAPVKPIGPLTSDPKYFESLNLDWPGLEAVKAAALKADWATAKTAYLQFRRTKSGVKWRIDAANKPAKAEAVTDEAADKIIAHIYKNPYGSNAPETTLGPDINWEFNPIPTTDPSFTREWTFITLNRMHQWDTLGAAYWKTGDEKYAREWVAQVLDWTKDNPVPIEAGPGETLTWRTIEAGIRMAGSWPNSYFRFLNSPSFSPEANLNYAKSCLEHAQRLNHIITNFPEHGGNWVAMESNGMGTAAILFPEWKQSGALLKTAFDRMDKELTAQVYPDGGQIELAPNYHQVSLNNFMQLFQTASLNTRPAPPEYTRKLKSMYQWNVRMMDQSGVLPPLNDSGSTNILASLREAHKMWGDEIFRWGATLGKEGNVAAPPLSDVLPYSGYYLMRGGWKPDDTYLLFDGGPIGSGHWHEDKLTLYMRAFNRTLLTEPGLYQYDKSKWRKYILGTTAHNTITVDGKEQHRGDKPQPKMETVKNPWITSPAFDYVSSTYDSGYQQVEYVAKEYMPLRFVGEREMSVTHTRHVVFLKPHYYLVVDFMHSPNGDNKPHRYDAFWHLDAPDATVDETTKTVRTRREDGVQLSLIPLETNGLQVQKYVGSEEPLLGWLPTQNRKIPTIVHSKTSPAPATFATLLYPTNAPDAPKVLWKDVPNLPANLWAREIETPYEKVLVAIKRVADGKSVSLSFDGQTVSSAENCIVVRRPKTQTAAP